MLEELNVSQGLAVIMVYKIYACKAREAELNGSKALECIAAGLFVAAMQFQLP
jgi:hypothetical protein